MRRLVFALLLVVCAGNVSAQSAFRVNRAGLRTGPAMILIPGLLSGGDVWDGTVDRFKSQYDMHVLTLAGFAGVPAASGDSAFLSTTRDAIIRYIRDNHLQHPVIVGHSLGGFLAFWIAATAPDLVGPIVAVDGVPYLSALGDTTMTPARAAQQAGMMQTMFAGMTAAALGAQSRNAMMSQVRDTAWYTRGAAWGAASDGKTAGKAIAEMMTTDIRGDVSRIATPVLLFMSNAGMTPAQSDAVFALYKAQVAGVRNARVVVAQNAHHFIMLDEPAFFYNTVASFLNSK
jgi:N-formylmaleamate deformylase